MGLGRIRLVVGVGTWKPGAVDLDKPKVGCLVWDGNRDG
jgi:hypothetical protein